MSDNPLVPVSAAPMPVSVFADPNGVNLAHWCSFHPETREDRLLVYGATNSPDSACKPLADCMGQRIAVRGIVIHQYVPSNGSADNEPELRRRTVLFGPDGQYFATSSDWVPLSVRDLMFVLGEGPWEPPAIVIPTKSPVARGQVFKLALELGVRKEAHETKKAK